MKKILVADLFDTLLPESPKYLNYLYGEGKKISTMYLTEELFEYVKPLQNKAIQELVSDLKEYLKSGNELVIVTNLDHMSFDTLIDNYLNKILVQLEQYKDQIKVYLKGRKSDLTHTIPNHGTVNEKDGNIIIHRNGTNLGFVIFKEDVFEHIDIKDKELHTIGDDRKSDLGMLLKGVELNGNSSMIGFPMAEKLEENILFMNFKSILGRVKLEEKANKLIELYQNKKIGIEELYRIKFLYEALEMYNFSRTCLPYRREKITDTEYIQNTLEKIQVVPSFKEYNREKILKLSQN